MINVLDMLYINLITVAHIKFYALFELCTCDIQIASKQVVRNSMIQII